MSVDLSSMTKKQLEKLQKDVEKALRNLHKKDKREARKAAEKAAQKFGFSLSELSGEAAPAVAAKSKPAKKPKAKAKKAAAAKYANPADPSQTWTGKGRQPVWFKDAVAAGKAPESMAI